VISGRGDGAWGFLFDQNLPATGKGHGGCPTSSASDCNDFDENSEKGEKGGQIDNCLHFLIRTPQIFEQRHDENWLENPLVATSAVAKAMPPRNPPQGEKTQSQILEITRH